LRLICKEGIGQEDKAGEIENYWHRVEANLRNGKVRLLFVADEIPRELRRLVEFLNSKMADVEVPAVEVKQFVGEGRRAVVPRVIGFIEGRRGGETKRRPLTREEFLAKCTPAAAQFFAGILDQAKNKDGRYSIYWGAMSFSIGVKLANGTRASFVYGYFPDCFEVFLAQLPLSEEEQVRWRQDLLQLGIFQAGGKFTLRATLAGEILSRISEVYDLVLNKVDEVMKRTEVSSDEPKNEASLRL
jgi:hypothetical protein